MGRNAISYDQRTNWPAARPTSKHVTIALVSQLVSVWWPASKSASQPVSKPSIIFTHCEAGRPVSNLAGLLQSGLDRFETGWVVNRAITYI